MPRLIVRADVVASQTAIHARWGGVVPEVAARQHVQNVILVIEEAVGPRAPLLAISMRWR